MSVQDQTVSSARVDFRRLKSLSVIRDYGIVIVFVTLFVVLSLASPVFFSRVNPFIATLATSIMIGGFALVLTSGNLISVLGNGHFTVLGRSDFETIKYSVWTLLAFTLLCGYLLSRTTYGRRVYASGGNPEAARLSGVRVNLVKPSTFALSGTAAGIAGVIVASRVATGQADLGSLVIAVDAGAGIVIGGTSILGGAGAIWRTVLGVLLLAMI